ncbi:alpha/beta fold hydrolase [Pseudonocardiaceae bacterium YIM PH 21723]|nr:alpha/beta fold hydrolase [Pseudonocardiaceae bacterium YIM PH 21723]
MPTPVLPYVVRFMGVRMRVVSLIVVLVGSLLVGVPVQAVGRCSDIRIPVASRPNQGPGDHIVGTLCLPQAGPVRELQVLVHGGTYDRTYWSLRGPETGPSYVHAMTAAGRATFALDRLGVAGSSRASTLDFDAQVFSVHQVIQALRARGIAPRVVGVGHSYGSTILRKLAVDHSSDVDALLLTGEAGIGEEEIDWPVYIHPATEDPQLAGRYDERYYTTRPGRRADLFAYGPGADPVALASDELAKQADVAPTEFLPSTINAGITVPVLVVIGDHDRLLCGSGACPGSATLQALEQRWYPRTRVDAEVLRDTGHSLTVHRGLRQLIGVVLGWRPGQQPVPAGGQAGQ